MAQCIKDPALLQMWCPGQGSVAGEGSAASVQPLAWELPHAIDVAKKKKKKKKVQLFPKRNLSAKDIEHQCFYSTTAVLIERIQLGA